jgi:SNF2 family DNA or RNA helicase
MINIVQAADRIYRTGSKSDATVRVFYGSGKDTIEMNILNALARKSIVTKGVLDKNNNTVFPSDYASEFD